MALFAIGQRVGANQRKTVLMIANRIQRNLPPLHRVTLFAGCPHFAAMNVGVAIRTLLADVGKHKTRVACGAGQLLVHPAQRILRLVVIELRYRADRLPTRTGVTTLARHRDRTMRVCHFCARNCRTRSGTISRFLPRHAHQQRNQSDPDCQRPAKSSKTVFHVPNPAFNGAFTKQTVGGSESHLTVLVVNSQSPIEFLERPRGREGIFAPGESTANPRRNAKVTHERSIRLFREKAQRAGRRIFRCDNYGSTMANLSFLRHPWQESLRGLLSRSFLVLKFT